MMAPQHFSDEELTAYLDGEYEFAPVIEIKAAMKRDAALRQRLDALSISHGDVKATFDRLLAKAPEAPHVNFPQRQRPSGWNISGLVQAAAAVLLLALGAAAGQYFSQPQLDGWRDYVAAYQSLYVEDTLSGITRSEAEAKAELARVTAAVGKPIELAALTGDPSLAYKRAQILGYGDMPLAQLTFLSNSGAPIALCVMRGTGPPQALSFATRQGLQSASWSQDGFEYLLIGGGNKTLIEHAARKFAGAV
jgi:anti-sigma factor RsiW